MRPFTLPLKKNVAPALLCARLAWLGVVFASAAPAQPQPGDVSTMMPPDTDFTQRVRPWTNQSDDDGSVHVMGNGLLCAYGQGPNLIQVFGPPYSSPPTFAQLHINDERPIESRSRRVRGAAIWRHELTREGRSIGSMIDFVDADGLFLVRKLELTQSLAFRLALPYGGFDNTPRFSERAATGALHTAVPTGTPIFHHFPTTTVRDHQIVTAGACRIEPAPQDNTWRVVAEPGNSFVYFVGGATYPESIEQAEAMLDTPWGEMFARTNARWQAFTDRRKAFAPEFSDDSPWPEQLLETIDDHAVLIKAQQGRSGSVLAGHFYHLGFIRDQYGVSRALLKMGYLDEARALLEHLWGVWRETGRLNNAAGIDVGGIAHVHENDDSEITGYLLVQAFNYLDASGDDAFVARILPMLDWAWTVQKEQLVDAMLPFNGDETYVAGGVLPRDCLNDGSAEATMLMVTGGARLIEWAETHDAWDAARVAAERAVQSEVAEKFRDNFWKDGRLLTNNPARRLTDTGTNDPRAVPRFRHGVCEGCHHFGWSEVNVNGRYCCPSCLMKNPPVPAIEPREHFVQSVTMVPLYLGSDALSRDEIRGLIDALFDAYESTGRLPSSPDGHKTVGLDYGLLLYSMVETGHPKADVIYDHMMSLIDPAGAWVEYYLDEVPSGCRCRPWEGGINVEAAIHTMQRKK